MKKQTSKNTLRLTTQTVRNLQALDLAGVGGGASYAIRCGWSVSCPAVCPSADKDCFILTQ